MWGKGLWTVRGEIWQFLKVFSIKKICETGWVEKEVLKCGSMNAIVKYTSLIVSYP